MLRILYFVMALALLSSCTHSPKASEEDATKAPRIGWEQELTLFRGQKDTAFALSKGSPFAGLKEDFAGLKYFAPDSDFRVSYQLMAIPNAKTIREIADSKGQVRKMTYCGELHFTIQGKKYHLPALTIAEDQAHFFIMFRDKTNGVSTYGGGRFLEVKYDSAGIIDFNYAYNPFCHYNENYSCPLVPKDHFLDLEIKAGEMKYH